MPIEVKINLLKWKFKDVFRKETELIVHNVWIIFVKDIFLTGHGSTHHGRSIFNFTNRRIQIASSIVAIFSIGISPVIATISFIARFAAVLVVGLLKLENYFYKIIIAWELLK